MLNWCNSNQMFINWHKTKFMFIHNKKNAFMPNSITIGNDEIEVVQSFKLLGIIIDASLLFTDCIKAMKKSINTKLYSFKKLFFLSKSVKSHFFKAFIQPHFDYCSALAVYLNKTQLKNIEKFQKVALFRLLNVKLFGLDHLTQKATLDKYKLMPYLMRLCFRLSTFCHKVTNKLLLISFSNNLVFKENCCSLSDCQDNCKRSKEIVSLPDIRTNFGRRSFTYFLPKFINCILKKNYEMCAKNFKLFLLKNLNVIFENYTKNFV